MVKASICILTYKNTKPKKCINGHETEYNKTTLKIMKTIEYE